MLFLVQPQMKVRRLPSVILMLLIAFISAPALASECTEARLQQFLTSLESKERQIYDVSIEQRESLTLRLFREADPVCYRHLTSSTDQGSVGDDLIAFRVLNLAIELSRSKVLEDAYDRSYERLVADKSDTAFVMNRYYYGLVNLRRFDEAKSLSEAHNLSVRKLPVGGVATSSDEDDSRIIYVAGADAWEPQQLLDVPSSQVNLIVVAHPTCKFSQAAATQFGLHQDQLRSIFDDIQWISGPGNETYFSETVAWNRNFPDSQLGLIGSSGYWGKLNDAQVPTFYVLLGDEIKQVIHGWPNDSVLDKIYSAGRSANHNSSLEEIGVPASR